ncbi:hypothetical protein Pcinc_025142 [Petrolisthes cinctipes]|uniref:Uncharacterized protein n=1 Tax=Petrolisthes cinctipes TaxID=88211 RepID=A0AAE1KDG0_PETCI|nr:hypothetical protein Pcinc_025142 [Petrolisthes cinctipes]
MRDLEIPFPAPPPSRPPPGAPRFHPPGGLVLSPPPAPVARWQPGRRQHRLCLLLRLSRVPAQVPALCNKVPALCIQIPTLCIQVPALCIQILALLYIDIDEC